MGSFENDAAADWACQFEWEDDLTSVELTFTEVENADPVDSYTAQEAIAACEVLARLGGHPGHWDGFSRPVDGWVATHPQAPPRGLLRRAVHVIDRVLARGCDLRMLWDEEYPGPWTECVLELRDRLTG